MKKDKALIFFQYLPPWRIDIFNEIANYYDLTIVFFNADSEGFTYNRKSLQSKLVNIKVIFLNNGFKVGDRPFRFGIFKIIKRINPRIVFVHEYSFISIQLAMYKMIHEKSFDLYITTSDNLAMAKNAKGLKRLSRDFVVKKSNGAIVYSEDVQSYYKKQYPNTKIDVCPNIQKPVSLLDYRPFFSTYIQDYKKKYNIKSGQIVLLYIGRLVYSKGLDLLFNAFANSNNDNCKIILVGEGDEKQSLIDLSLKLGIEDKVVFTGFYSGISLYAWYDIASFLVIPSRFEPFGAVVNEALIYGCPVLASNKIGAISFIDNENGIIFDPNNLSEFVSCLNKAYIKYSKITYPRNNLMRHSFIEYTKVFLK